jgi:hypothetical protein
LKGGNTLGARTRVGLPARVRLAEVMARALFGVGSGSRIRLAGSGLAGLGIRLAGLSWGRAKPLSRIGLSCIP